MIYTKEGRPLHRSGDNLFAASGTHVARLRGDRAYSPNGSYVGTLVNDRLIYRSTDSATIGSPFVQISRAGFAAANAVGTAAWGDEPPIPN